MRTKILVALLASAVFSSMAGAQESVLDGRRIILKAGSHARLNVPVSLFCEVPSPDEELSVVELTTGKQFPATIYGGKLTFVPEGARPESEHTYEVRVGGMNPEPVVAIEKEEGQDALDIRIYDKLFSTYHYSKEYKKPFLWPVIAEGDVGITRDFPMGEKDLTDDHPHHKSFYVAYGNVNGVDCWGEGENSGFQVTQDVKWGSGQAYGWITATNLWQSKEHETVLTERREYRFYAGPEKARLVDVEVTFEATHGDVLFGDTKEGGIVTVRMRDTMTEEEGGTITNAEGGVGAGACWGKPAAWCDYSAPVDDVGVRGIAIFDHPTNLRAPTRWHVRDYGLMGANCFGLSHFVGEGANGDYLLKAGDTLTFKYRVYVHSGDVKEAAVAGRYADYAAPPEVAWEKP